MGRLINLGGGVLCLCAASQFPEFSQQYVQRLGGGVDELRAVVARFDATAQSLGLTRREALTRPTSDDLLRGLQQDAARNIERLDRLSTHYEALRGASAWDRLRAIARFDDATIAQRAWEDFKPAVPLTWDGLVFALGGFAAGFLALFGLGRGGRAVRRRIWPEEDIFAERADP